VWRSGVGVDRHGNLIYAAGEDQSVGSLADTFAHAGAVRAMELDINSYWVSFINSASRAATPRAEKTRRTCCPAWKGRDTRYLEPDDRDFFAVY